MLPQREKDVVIFLTHPLLDFYSSGLPAYDTVCPTEPLNNKSLFILGGLTWTLSSSFVYEYYFLWPDAAYAINYIPSSEFPSLSFPLSGADIQPLGLAYLTKLYIGMLTENSRNYSYTSTYILKFLYGDILHTVKIYYITVFNITATVMQP